MQLSKPKGVRRGVPGLVLALVACVWGLVVPAAAGAASVPSIDQVYAVVAGLPAHAGGRVDHSVITPVGSAGDTTRSEWWVDASRYVARGKQQLEAGSPVYASDTDRRRRTVRGTRSPGSSVDVSRCVGVGGCGPSVAPDRRSGQRRR